jgi:LacI family repressor for deo operon, udp, cdd, tsx, nupC, and nupG
MSDREERPRRATIYDVARDAGVSISTVSLAINQPRRVNDATRKSVIDTAVRLGYRGPSHASAGKRFAVAAPFSTYPSYYARLTGMLKVASSIGIELIIHDLPSTAAEEAPILRALPVKAGIDGIIVMGAPLSRDAMTSVSLPGPPVVLVDVPDSTGVHPDIPVVLIDDRRGGELIGRHLADEGHQRVAFVHELQRSDEYVSAGMLRAEGLSRFVECVAVELDDPSLLSELIGDALRDERTTAVVANHDQLAASVIACLDEMPPPRSIAIVGYDGGDLAQSLGLTSVWQPFEESGRAAMRLLLDLVGGEHPNLGSLTLTPKLVVRRSSSTSAG